MKRLNCFLKINTVGLQTEEDEISGQILINHHTDDDPQNTNSFKLSRFNFQSLLRI